MPDPGPEPELEVDETLDDEPALSIPSGGFWRRVSELLAAVWLVTLLAWWWTARPAKRESQGPAPIPVHRQQSRLLKDARKSARAGEGARVRDLILEWAALEWPDNPPRSVGHLADRVSPDLAGELQAMSRLSYGPNPGDFDGEALAKALRSFSVLKDEDSAVTEELPPLMPGA